MKCKEADLALYSGTANLALATAVASRIGQPLGRRVLTRFPDGEIHVQIEDSIRGKDVYIIQPTGPPVNENLMELLLLVDAFHRASAARITTVIPYFGYARQEKKSTGREPIAAKVVADLITAVGTNRVVSVDLHAPAIQGFFNIGMDHLTAVPILASYLQNLRQEDTVVVSPDLGRMKLADSYARALRVPLIVLHKRRIGPDQVEVRGVVGEVQDRLPIIIDDMISTGRTIDQSVAALLAAGARPEITVAAVHPLLVGPAIDYLRNEAIRQVVVTDTLPIVPEQRLAKVVVLSIASLLAETITRLHENRSISTLFAPRFDIHPV